MTGAAGALLGIAVLVRPALLFLAPGVGLLAVWEARAARWRFLPGLGFAAIALLALLPWQLHNDREGLGITTISTAGGIDLWMGNNDAATAGGLYGDSDAAEAAGFPAREPERDRALRDAAIDWIVTHPGRYLELSATRAQRMWGTPPDKWAARFLWPTAENDAAQQAASDDARQMLARRQRVLLRFRIVIAPLVLLAVFACLRRRRSFAPVLLPLAAYATLLAFTFFQERFREVSDPLLLVPLAALLSDLALGTAELGWPRHRHALLGGACALVLASAIYRVALS